MKLKIFLATNVTEPCERHVAVTRFVTNLGVVMKALKLMISLSFLAVLFIIPQNNAVSQQAGQSHFVSAYYADFSMYHYPPELIDYSAMTHIIHFAVGVSTTPPYLSVP